MPVLTGLAHPPSDCIVCVHMQIEAETGTYCLHCASWEKEAAATSTTLCVKQVCVLLHHLLGQTQTRTVLWGYTVSLWLIFCCQLTI